MKPVLGSALSPENRQDALSRFVHRFTGDHRPAWAAVGREDRTPFPVQFANDADWLAHTIFHITEDGRISGRRGCESSPTWPNNPELRETQR